MLFQKLPVAALLALVASAAAEPKWTKAAPNQLGLLRRADDPAYVPETTVCGEGNSCAEACGDGYVLCAATSGENNHCYNEAAGESCCDFVGKGNSCDVGYFCAHDVEVNTVCCAEGKTVEECAKINKVAGGSLTSDPPVESATPTPTSSSYGESSSSSSKTRKYKPHSSGYGAMPTNGTSSYPTEPATPTETVETIPEGAAPRTGAAAGAVLLAAGAFAALF